MVISVSFNKGERLKFKCFICSEYYEEGAMLIEDEGMVIPGLLVGLNVIDCNMCIKEEDLDQPVSRNTMFIYN